MLMGKIKNIALSPSMIRDMKNLSEVPDLQRVIEKACQHYLACLKLQKDGYVIVGYPAKINDEGKFVLEQRTNRKLILLED